MDRLGITIRENQTLAAALLFLLLAFVFLFGVLIPSPAEVLGGYDMRGLFHVLMSTVSESVKGGSLPLWNPYLFNGFPLMADPQAGTFYPINWLSIVLPVSIGISWYLLIHIWLAGFGMFAFVRTIGGRWFPALLAGLVFAFGGVLAGRLWAGHSIVYAVFAWSPWLLLGLTWSIRSGSVWSAVIAGVPLGLAILTGHLPSLIYVMMIWSAWVLFQLITEPSKRLLVLRQALIMVVVGLGLSAIQLLPTVQLTLLSERADLADYDFATRFSFPPSHLTTLVVPEFFGEPLRAGYWSVPTFEELTYYAGILSILLIALSLIRADRLTWFYVSLMVFGILLAMGSYGVLHRLLYGIFPPMRLMRAPARAGLLFFFSSAALLGHALSRWQSSSQEDRATILTPALRWLIAILVIAGALAIAAAGAVFISVHPTDTSGRLWHQVGGFAFALLLVVINGVLLWAFLIKRPKDKRMRFLVMAGLVLIVLVDLWTFSFKFVRTEPVGPDQLWTDAKQIIGESNAGVLPWGLNIFTQNGGMQVELRSVFGYNSLAPRNHLALASSIPDPRSTAYDILGTEYVISEAALDQFTEGDSGIQLIEGSPSVKVYRRPNALPVGRILYDLEIIADDQTAIARVHGPDFDPARTAIVGSDPGCEIGPEPATIGMVEIIESQPGSWKMTTESASPGLLVLAENAYPGWEVFVDGDKEDLQVAYTSLKAVCIPAGDHVVEWLISPGVFTLGLVITLVALAVVGVAIFMTVSKRSTHGEKPSDDR